MREAMARPIPLVAPVMTAVLPRKSKRFMLVSALSASGDIDALQQRLCILQGEGPAGRGTVIAEQSADDRRFGSIVPTLREDDAGPVAGDEAAPHSGAHPGIRLI